MKTLIFVLLFCTSQIFGTNPTDIKTKYGTWINVQIIDSTEAYYIIKTTVGNRTVYKESILQILNIPFNPSIQSALVDVPSSIQNTTTQTTTPTLKDQYEYPNLLMLPLTLALGYLSYDYFKSASDLETQEDNFTDLGLELDYKDQKTRYTIGGVIFLVAAITNTVFALKSVKVSGSNNSIGLSYNF